MAVIALDIGGTKISGALLDDRGEVVARRKRFLEGRSHEAAGELVVAVASELAGMAVEDASGHLLMGVCVPGIAWSEKGTVWAPNIAGWDNFPLRDFLVQAFPERKCEVFIASDRTCHMLGEVWKGNARGCSDVVYMAIGTGIGVGILSGGRILHGSGDIAGAAGWMAVESSWKTGYRRCGCLEYYASGLGMAARAGDMLRDHPALESRLRNIPAGAITAGDLFNALETEDPVASAVVAGAVRYWGMAAANLVSLLNPRKIIWGGGVFGPALRLLDQIHKEASRWAQPLAFEDVTFEPSAIQEDAGLAGAGFLALQGRENKK